MMKMSKVMPRREYRDREVIEATFNAISAALGWDKESPRDELFRAVRARMIHSAVDVVASFDEDLAKKLNPSTEGGEL